jgi:putative ABC transport system permease protein
MRPEHWLYTIPLRLRSLFRRAQADYELDDELRDHLERKTEEYIAQGMTQEEAHRRARLELEGTEQTKEKCRDARRVNWIQEFVQDLRFGLRMLHKSPGFTAVTVLTLALGIAANTTIFSALSAILLRKPPVKDPDSLCAVASTNKSSADLLWASAPDFKSWQQQNEVFEDMAAVESGRSFTLTGNIAPQSVVGDRVTPEYFKIVGIAPLLGRTFLPAESQAGKNHVVILSTDLWRERYGSDPKVIGEDVHINGEPYAIVGVMPQRASLPLPFVPPRLWTPLAFSADDLSPSGRGDHYINMVVARLKPGATIQRAQAAMDSVAARLATAYPDTNKDWGITVLTLQEYLIRHEQARPVMAMLLSVVGFVLLIACANIAGLLLARSAVRGHEIAVRAALGAGRLRLLRQMLTESFLMASAGGAGGLVLSIWGIRLLRTGFNFNSVGEQLGRHIHLDPRTLLFTLGVSFFAAIFFGVAPALRASNVNPGDALTECGRANSGDFARSRFRNALVIGEIALAVLLLASAGTVMREVIREFSQPAGFNSHHLVVADLHLDSKRYSTAPARIALFEQITESLRRVAGIESAGLTNCVPLACGYSTSFTIPGQQPVPESEKPSADYFVIEPGYFETMQIPLTKGREFVASDNSNAPAVAIVSQEFVRRYFPGGDAIGRQIEAATLNAKSAQIVGIVGNASVYPGQKFPHAQIYECDLQFPFTAFPSTSLVVRSQIAPAALAPMLRRAVWSVDKDQPMGSIQTIQDLLADELGGDKLIMDLLGIFAGLALLLAAIGIYGVVAYSVSQRTREIGVRVALGAERKDVFGLVLRQGGSLIGVGCAIGVLLAVPMPRVLSGMVGNGIEKGLFVAIAVTFIVAIVASLACYIPARRAMRVDPMVALRYE